MKPLGNTQRKILIAAALHHREHGQAPLWRELREPLQLGRGEFLQRMLALRKQGHVTFTAEPRSLRVTPQGLAAALNGKRPRPT